MDRGQLQSLLDSGRPVDRSRAFATLDRMDDPGYLEALLLLYGTDDREVRARILRLVGKMSPPTVRAKFVDLWTEEDLRPPIVVFLSDADDPADRGLVERLLRFERDPDNVQALKALLRRWPDDMPEPEAACLRAAPWESPPWGPPVAVASAVGRPPAGLPEAALPAVALPPVALPEPDVAVEDGSPAHPVMESARLVRWGAWALLAASLAGSLLAVRDNFRPESPLGVLCLVVAIASVSLAVVLSGLTDRATVALTSYALFNLPLTVSLVRGDAPAASFRLAGLAAGTWATLVCLTAAVGLGVLVLGAPGAAGWRRWTRLALAAPCGYCAVGMLVYLRAGVPMERLFSAALLPGLPAAAQPLPLFFCVVLPVAVVGLAGAALLSVPRGRRAWLAWSLAALACVGQPFVMGQAIAARAVRGPAALSR